MAVRGRQFSVESVKIGIPYTHNIKNRKPKPSIQGARVRAGQYFFAPNGKKLPVALTLAVINSPLTLSTVKAHNLLTKFYREQ
jgi:hypothetical protein